MKYNRQLIEEIRQNAKDVAPRSLVLNQDELGVLFAAVDASRDKWEKFEQANEKEQLVMMLQRAGIRCHIESDAEHQAVVVYGRTKEETKSRPVLHMHFDENGNLYKYHERAERHAS